MRASSESTRAIVGAIVGFVYGSILAYLSLAAMGAGHGSFLPYFLSSAPLGVFGRFGEFAFFAALVGTPVICATFGSLVAPSNRPKWRRLPRVLVLLQYASGLALVAATTGLDELTRLERVLRTAPEVVVPWAAVYLVGQVALWWRISRCSELRRD